MNPDNIKNPKYYSKWKIQPVEFIVENDTKDDIAEENIDEKDDDGIMYDLSKLTNDIILTSS